MRFASIYLAEPDGYGRTGGQVDAIRECLFGGTRRIWLYVLVHGIMVEEGERVEGLR